MLETSAIMISHQRYAAWSIVTLGAPALTAARPGQYVALRCTAPGSWDPLVRAPLFVSATDATAGTIALLVAHDDPAFPFLAAQPPGATLDLLGAIGNGWQIDATVRTMAIVGIAEYAAPLFALAAHAIERGIAVSLILGTISREAAPPAHLLPPAAEYNLAQSNVPAAAALKQLDDSVLRWADLLAIALPHEYWSATAQRVSKARIRWSREFAQIMVIPPLLCHVGVCGACAIETRRSRRLACIDGPIFALADLVR